MGFFIFLIILILIIAILFCAAVLYCFINIFYTKKIIPSKKKEDPYVPEGKTYAPYREKFKEWILAARTISHEDIEITSHDGLTLRGKYYEYKQGAPIELILHGWRGNAERDLSGAVMRSFAVGHSALIVDNRGCGRSDGHFSSFGVLESEDCMAWIDYIIDYIDFSAKIILTGISMGAATVAMVGSRDDLPENVIGILADCGYTSAEDIISKVVDEMNLPSRLVMPFVNISTRVLGKFDLKKASVINNISNCSLPIIFFHGDNDKFVPCEMSMKNYESCGSKTKRLVIIEGAGHGLCYIVNPSRYIMELKKFFDPITEKSDFDEGN